MRNISPDSIVVTAELQRGKAQAQLAEFTLRPGEAREVLVPADALPEQPDGTGIEVRHTGPPGALIGYWFSTDESGSLVVETPLRSPAPNAHGAGTNPWSLESDSSSVLYIKNTGAEKGAAVVNLWYPGGEYMIGVKNIEPGQTEAIDIRKLRDEQLSDVHGHRLPADLAAGQILWTWHHGPPLVGRVNAMSVSKGVASNMSCPSCCECPSTVSVSLVPASSVGAVGTGFQEEPWEIDSNNCGTRSFPVPASWLTWWSSNSTVASVNTGWVGCTSPGTATIFGSGPCCGTDINPDADPETDGCFVCGPTFPPEEGSADVTAVEPKLSCSPSPATRGQTATCTASVTGAPAGATISYSGWKFTDGTNTVTSTNSAATWSGTMVVGGTVSVTIKVNQQSFPLSASVSVNNRNWHTSPASANQVPNGTFITLPVPPQNTGQDSGLGSSQWRAEDSGAPGSTIADNGPNHGFYFYTSPLTFPVFDYRYEINPDLENSETTFSQHQCGNYNANSNPSGFISWANLLAQTQRHEYAGLIQSHYAFYRNAVNTNNPGDYVESRVGSPGTNIAQFDLDTKNGRDARYASIGSATAIEPFGVNLSESGTFLGNINYMPYATCN